MSSNTLRGIGQEGDGDAEARPASAKGDQPSGGADDQPNRPVGRMKDLQELRSSAARADGRAAAPREGGPRNLPSLDAAVPEAAPSLDGKVPALAGTLLGVSAPVVTVGVRDKGTVQGRDVHLPIEAQRMAAGMRAVGAVPSLRLSPADHAVAVVVDPAGAAAAGARVRTPLLNQSVDGDPGADGTRHTARRRPGPTHELPSAPGDVGAHDGKPNLIGRVAIGVAVAAALSVVILGIIRMNAPAPGRDTTQSNFRPPESYKSHPTPLALPASEGETPPSDRATGSAGPGTGASEPGASSPPPRSFLDEVAANPDSAGEGRGGTTKTRATTPSTTAARPGSPPLPKTPVRPLPPTTPRAGALGSTPPRAPAITPATEPPSLLGTPLAVPPKPASEPGSLAPLPTRPSGSTDKSRPRGADDPDSTLPLNFD